MRSGIQSPILMKFRYMKRILYSIGILISLSLLVSCERDEMSIVDIEENSELNSGSFVSVPAALACNPFDAGLESINVKAEDYKSNEYKINDFWLLQFDGTADDSKFLAAVYHPFNATMEQSYVKMDETKLKDTKCVWIVANVNNIDSAPFSSYTPGETTLGTFKQDGVKIKDVDDLGEVMTTEEQVQAGYSIPMSGWCEFDIDKNNLEIELKSIVSKLTIKYNIPSGTYKLNSIKLFRVPEKLSYSPESVSPTVYKLLTYEYLISSSAASSGTVTLYIPQNRQQATVNKDGSLSNAANSPKTKTENAPAKATYFSLGLTKSDDNASVNVFPGGSTDGATNAYDCYEILANAHYTEIVNINSGNVDSYLGDNNDDSRLIEIQRHDITSNCYILNPLLSGQKESNDYYASVHREECYALPVVHRVNEGWNIGDKSNTIGDKDEWMMHVVWQDQPGRLVYFVESSGLKSWRNKEGEIIYHMPVTSSNNPNNMNYATEYYGRGNGDNGFVYVYAERNPSVAKYNRGNVLIALRKKDPQGTFVAENGEKYGEILWSWHLWVTDYNPDFVISTAGTYTGIVRGNMENGTEEKRRSRVFKYGFWKGEYNYSWIMDRHLGARGWMPAGMAENYGKDGTEGFGLFYQWGRKDPFPGGNPAAIVKGDKNFGQGGLNNGSDVVADGNNNLLLYKPVIVNGVERNLLTLYNIYGEAKTSLENAFEVEATDLPANIWETMSEPYTIYNGNIDFLPSKHMYDGENWNNPPEYKSLDPKPSTKTLFDPCPPGWELPSYKAFSGEDNSTSSGFIYKLSSTGADNVLDGDNYYVEGYFSQSTNTSESGVRSYIINVSPEGTSDDSYDCTYFPRSGWITATGRRDLRGLCDLWTVESKPNFDDLGTYLYIGHGLDGNVKTFVAPTIHVSTTSDSNIASYFSKKSAFGVRCVKR